MRRLHQIPRATLAWLLLSMVAVTVPHLSFLPIWVIACFAFILFWRIQLHRGRWILPGRWLKLVLALTAIVGLRFDYGSLLGLEPMVSLLIIAMVLKLLEMYAHRDAMTIIFLCFFITATQYLFSQLILDFLYSLFCMLLLLATLISLHGEPDEKRGSVIAASARMILQSLPVMMVLFLLFPRLGSLWAMPVPQESAKTGVSETMSPGDFSKLTRDGGKAFTVSFADALPAQSDLYWRGLVLSHFDGRTWTVNRWGSYPDGTAVSWNRISTSAHSRWLDQAEPQSEAINYQVILEPTQRAWLFGLPLAKSDKNDSGLTRDFTLVKQGPVASRYVYNVSSSLQYRLQADGLESWMISRNTQLPEDFNPQTRAEAARWVASGLTPEAIIERFLQWVGGEFSYTLEPPALGENSVDEFLFQSKRGFCEHFASSFVVFMRAAGVPARVVTGYQGGEWVEDFLQVSQADAHAWAEVWLADRGWVRVDPTAAVAPARVQTGINSVFERSVSNPLSMEAYRHIGIVNSLRLQLDVWNYRWQRWVLNYDQESQWELLKSVLGEVHWWKLSALILGGLALTLGLSTGYLWWRNRPPPVAAELQTYHRLCRAARKLRCAKRAGETPQQYLRRLSELLPHHAPELLEFEHLFERALFADDPDARARLLRKFRSPNLSLPERSIASKAAV